MMYFMNNIYNEEKNNEGLIHSTVTSEKTTEHKVVNIFLSSIQET